MRVVGGDERDVQIFFEAEHGFGDLAVGREAVVLNFEEVVPSPEEIFVEAGADFGRFVVAGHDVLRDFAGEAARETDEAFGVFGEKFFADARLAIEAVQRGLAGKSNEVFIARFVFGEDEHVVVLGVGVGLAAMILFLADIELAAEDGLQVALLHGVEEVDGAVDIAVVGDGGRGLPDLFEMLGELVYVAGAVEERVIGVQMEVGELGGHSSSLLPRVWSIR